MEGGIQGGANTICAPQNAACNSKAQVPVKTNSEQDFQRMAHSDLGGKAVFGNNPGYTWEFHFRTEWNDDDGSAATYVEWYDDTGGGFHTGHQKREEGPTHLVVNAYHTNGTVRSRRYPLDEVCDSTFVQDMKILLTRYMQRIALYRDGLMTTMLRFTDHSTNPLIPLSESRRLSQLWISQGPSLKDNQTRPCTTTRIKC